MNRTDSPYRIFPVKVEDKDRTIDFKILKNGEVIAVGYSFLWDFGDGNRSEEPFPLHTYAKPGTYVVKCKVSPNIGRSDQDDEHGGGGEPDPPPEEITT